MDNEASYYTYILRCENGALYCGITTDLSRRINEHTGKAAGGAKYTHANPPKKCEAVWKSGSRSDASRLEYYIKKLPKAKKEKLILSPVNLCSFIPCVNGEAYEFVKKRKTTKNPF